MCLSEVHTDSELRLFTIVYVTCINIATKIWGGKFSNFARAVLADVGIDVPQDLAYDVEYECLHRLKWRLIPVAPDDEMPSSVMPRATCAPVPA